MELYNTIGGWIVKGMSRSRPARQYTVIQQECSTVKGATAPQMAGLQKDHQPMKAQHGRPCKTWSMNGW